jgi:CheY-like chemotaxis protein
VTAGEPLNILLVDDSPSDVEITREALNASAIPHRMTVLTHGDEVMPYLTGTALPDLILLDLNLPGMGGRELLEQIKVDPELRLSPVVILSTSSHERDIREAYQSYANAYLIKPVDWASFEQIAHDLASFWSNAARPPALRAGREAH